MSQEIFRKLRQMLMEKLDVTGNLQTRKFWKRLMS